MSNQRAGKFKPAAMDSGDRVSLSAVVRYLRDAAEALNRDGYEDAAHYFEMAEDYFRNDVGSGKPVVYSDRTLGL